MLRKRPETMIENAHRPVPPGKAQPVSSSLFFSFEEFNWLVALSAGQSVNASSASFHQPQKKQEDAIADVAEAWLRIRSGARAKKSSTMNPEEQIVTWLISLGALNSPKMRIGNPEQFLKMSLKDGVVLCKLALRLFPGSIQKVRVKS